MASPNRRKDPRIDYAVKVSDAKGSLGLAKNFSIGGGFIETNETIDNTFNVSYELNKSLKVVNMKCVVMWKNNFGIGTRFNLDNESRKILSKWLFVKKVEQKGIRI